MTNTPRKPAHEAPAVHGGEALAHESTINSAINVAIVGASGYSGAELVSLLLAHPHARLVGLFASGKREKGDGINAATSFEDVFPRFRGRLDLPILPTDLATVVATGAKAVFLATPHEASMELAPKLLNAGITVLDLSGAFRLDDAALYPKHYGFAHTEPSLLRSAVFGLPEIFRDAIRSANLIACPGCYPTSAILPLRPLVDAGVIEPGRRPVVDSTSGVSGAGRSAWVKSLFCEVSLQPYNVFSHRHNPEIDRYCGTPVVFTPHLGAFDRGILSTIHVDLARGVNAANLAEIYTRAYADETFVRLLPAGQWPSVADVRGTNFCDIGWALDEANRHLILVSAIDNLVKGASGQAVQCMNVRYGFDERTGILPLTSKNSLTRSNGGEE